MDITKNDAGLHEITIDGRVYEFEKWGAERALTTLPDIMQLVQPVLEKAAAAIERKEDIPVLTLLPHLISALCTHRGRLVPMCRAFTVGQVCDHKRIKQESFDTHFADLFHLAHVLAAAVEVQYGDFFGRVRSMLSTRTQPSGSLAA